MFPLGLAQQQELSDLSGVVEESVTGVRVVKGFGAERLQRKRLGGEADSVYDYSIKQARLRANFMPQIDLLPALGLVGILWYGGHQVLDGNLTIGTIVAANLYVLMLIWPLRMVGMLLAQLPRSAAAAGRINDVLITDPAIEDVPHARALPDGPGEVRFDDVTFGYGSDRIVLDGLDLVIPGGQAIALVGATASGKSTVARLIPRFYDIDAGRISVDGADVREARLQRGPPRGRPGVRRHVPLLRQRARQHRVRRSGSRDGRRGARRPGSRAPTTSYASCPTATRRSSASTATPCRAVSGSGSRSRVRCSPTRAS